MFDGRERMFVDAGVCIIHGDLDKRLSAE